jgi:hypothetical protein
MADLFTLLEDDWRLWRLHRDVDGALTRWQQESPPLRVVESVDDLLAVFEDRAARDAHDELLLALLSAAQVDADAHRTLLRVLRAGLIALAARAHAWWEWDDASSAVVAAALDRIARYPGHRTSRVAANLLGDVWHSVWAERQVELRRRTGWGSRVDLEAVDALTDRAESKRGDELMALIDEAVRLRRITPYDGRLVALHRVHGYTNVEVGRIEGKQPCTIRKRRLAAEAAITAMAVA